jgi:hypothetical protein
LINVELKEGLESIKKWAFEGCTSLEQISIPHSVKVIGYETFKGCTQLMNLELREGLERINARAFRDCTSLEHISIPFTVHYIHQDAFKDCNELGGIEFCEEIEEFVTELSLRHWWNNGTPKLALLMGSFLKRCNIPRRVSVITMRVWKENIHGMLQRVPLVISFKEKEEEDDNAAACAADVYFDSINSLLAKYEHAQDIAPLLELALWKSKITEQTNGNRIDDDLKLMCRINSLSMVNVIVPIVMSFLVDE